MLNLFEVKPGQQVRLKSGAICEVVDNIGDGIWLQLRTLSDPNDAGRVGTDELVHCEEMMGLVTASKS